MHQLTIYPDLQCFVANKELLIELNKNLQVKSNEVPLLSYDTPSLIGTSMYQFLNMFCLNAVQLFQWHSTSMAGNLRKSIMIFGGKSAN